MKSPNGLVRFALLSATGLLLAGCLFRPATVSERRFVLSPLPPSGRAPAAAESLPVGVGLVKMPPYLLRSSLAVRKGVGEIQYIEDALWAEPLDQDFQRTLAANLSRLLPTAQIYLSAWERDQVKVGVFVTVEQFDVDTQGRGTLSAWWRITFPGSDKPVKSGQVNLVQTGASPRGNPQAIVATLSALTADLSRLLAAGIRESASPEESKK